MGVSGKWIRALVGLKKPEKSQSSEKNENVGIISIIFFFEKKKKLFTFHRLLNLSIFSLFSSSAD